MSYDLCLLESFLQHKNDVLHMTGNRFAVHPLQDKERKSLYSINKII